MCYGQARQWHSVPAMRMFARAILMAGCWTGPAARDVSYGQTPDTAPAGAPGALTVTLPPVDIVASRYDLLGRAVTASQGEITKEELDLRPIYRIGQLLELVPGLVVTVHSGKARPISI